MLARAGAEPILLERGSAVDERKADVEKFYQTRALDTESNIQFGEGGAGAFSDGKLNTGTHDKRGRQVLHDLVQAGAPDEILWQAKPHIGTDRLPDAVKGLREMILAHGGEVRFRTKLTDIELSGEALRAVRLAHGGAEEALEADSLILAAGHSARELFALLKERGAQLEQKAFSMGVRCEHPQEVISRAQYGAFAAHPALGAADYRLAVHLPDGRGVYTFCMCPGGYVVGAASEEGLLCVNGMSPFARDGQNANAAVLCEVRPSDCGSADPLAGVELQRRWERAAFLAGGGDYRAPAQRLGDFLAGKPSESAGSVAPTYPLGVRFGTLDGCLPEFVLAALREATDDSMTRDEMLRAMYLYVRDSFTYLRRHYYKTGDVGWATQEALTMYSTGRGNCYCFASAFWAAARALGFDAKIVSGTYGEEEAPHGWVEILRGGVRSL